MKRVFLLMLFLLSLIVSNANAQVTSLGASTESITILLSGAAATNEAVYNLTWSSPSGGVTTAIGATSGATPVTALAGPDGSPTRVVDNISVYNADTAAVTVTVNKKVGSTSYPILKQSLPAAATLTWNGRSGIAIGATTAVANVGAVAGTGVTVSEQGNGVIQKSVFTLSSATMTAADATQGVGTKIYDFPEGRIFILGATGSNTFTTTSAILTTLNGSVSCRWGVGTVTQTNATLATTEQDIIPVTTFTSGATINAANTATTAALATAAQFDGTATAKDAYFNISVPGATDIDADATVSVNGTVTITWVFLGDY